jgi:hypothetical protein
MKLSFVPGDLHLTKNSDGEYVLQMTGVEVLRTRSQRVAVSRFNKLRTEMESRYPAHELTTEERAESLRRIIGDYLVGHKSLGGRKKKTTAGGTRTFGG